jgi:hypothetical protein
MKKFFIFTLFIFALYGNLLPQSVDYDTYFLDKSLRVDFSHAGNINEAFYYLEQLKSEPYFSGSKTNLIDPIDNGEYKVMVYSKDGNLIFTRGFTTLFQEWRTTEEAKTVSRSFYESIQIPYPKDTVIFEIHNRLKSGTFEKKFTMKIDPSSYLINPEIVNAYPVNEILKSGDPSKKLDIVLLPEGYTAVEMEKYHQDAKRLMDYMLGCSPYKENKNNINFWTVDAPSKESSTDFPKKGIFRNTIFNTSFSTFGTDRYLMTTDVKTLRDVAANVPYDQIIIIANTDVYGGGAIYNCYTCTTSDNQHADYLICHEFGHCLGGLADEYYTSDVAVQDYYDLNVEPYEPNITTLVNFEKKWKSMVTPGTPIPTPLTKEYENSVGAFEGGGYVAKGVYRPMQDCTMKSIVYDKFCPVCKKAINDVIKYYCE